MAPNPTEISRWSLEEIWVYVCDILRKCCRINFVLITVHFTVIDYYSWEWEDEKGRWNPYPAGTVIKVENCQQQDKKSVGLDQRVDPTL